MDNLQQLFIATQHNNVNKVQELLDGEIFVDGQDGNGNTALQYAAANGHDTIVQLLLDQDASVDLSNEYGWTPLMHAVHHGHISTVVILLNKKAKVNTRNKLGLQPLAAAAWNGDLSMVLILLEAGAVLNTQGSEDNTMECELTPLIAATLQGQKKIVCTLLEQGCLINQTVTATGHTPLMMAACNGYTETVKILVEHDAHVNATDICNRNALDIAMMLDKQEVAAYLKSKTVTKVHTDVKEKTEIIDAVKDGDTVLLQKLLKKDNSYCNYHLSDGTTPLMYAAALGQEGIVNLLIKHGAKLDEQDLSYGWTALMQAVINKRTTIVQNLIEAGADVNIQANDSCKALDLAYLLEEADSEVNKLLIERTDSATIHVSSVPSQENIVMKSRSSSGNRYIPKEPQRNTSFRNWLGEMSSSVFNRLQSTRSSRQSLPSSSFETLSPSTTDVFLSPNETIENIQNDKSLHSTRLSLSSFPSLGQLPSSQKNFPNVVPPPLFNPLLELKKGESFIKQGHRIVPDARIKRNTSTSLYPVHLLKKRYILATLPQEALPSANVYNNEDNGIQSVSKRLQKKWNAREEKSKSFQRFSGSFSDTLCESPDSTSTLESSSNLDKTLIPSKAESISIGGRHPQMPAVGNQKEDQIEALLRHLSLGEYIEKFKSQEIDMEVFHNLTDDDLQELGVHTLQTRQKLLAIINICPTVEK